MEPNDFDSGISKLEQTTQQRSQIQFDASLDPYDWKRRLCREFINGIVRGLGFSIGFSILGALLLYVLRRVALSNLPVIGRFLADLVKIVENNLS